MAVMKPCARHFPAVDLHRSTRRHASHARFARRARIGRAFGALTLAAAFASVASAQVGTNYCSAAPNSTGSAATMSGSGSAVVHLNDLVLTSSGLPQNAAAYFLSSRTRGFVMNPGGSAGNLCVGSPIGRLVGGVIANSGSTGIVDVAADLTAMPQPNGAVVVVPGDTWNFQCWYRDAVGGSATSNFSDGLAVLFTATQTVAGMVPIPAGTFSMGSNAPTGPPYFGPIGPVHQVTISAPFWMGQNEVTQAEWQALMGTNPSFFPGASRPVERVTWHAARAYCAALTSRQAANIPAGYEYRLPTEAEWEYACRAGTTTEFHTGSSLLCSQAWFSHSWHSVPPASCNIPFGTTPVGSYAPNAFGLKDMHGNVWEWCLDSYAPYSAAAVTDPFVTGGPERVLRGGSLGDDSSNCRSAFRFTFFPGDTDGSIGFRVALAPVLVP